MFYLRGSLPNHGEWIFTAILRRKFLRDSSFNFQSRRLVMIFFCSFPRVPSTIERLLCIDGQTVQYFSFCSGYEGILPNVRILLWLLRCKVKCEIVKPLISLTFVHDHRYIKTDSSTVPILLNKITVSIILYLLGPSLVLEGWRRIILVFHFLTEVFKMRTRSLVLE